jgi:antitoxin component YwqK of YwqJK toxin-antitoxin module
MKEEYYKDNKKLKHGLITEFYDNGKKSIIGTYKNGERDGLWTQWYENRQIKSEENFKGWKKHGEQIYYHKNGQISSESNYKDGKEHGKQISYDKNGQISSEMIWKDDETIYYYENGLIEEISGSNRECWDEDGNECKCRFWSKGCK